MKTHIIYPNYLTPDGERMSVGGIQTYLFNLSRVLLELGRDVCLYQISVRPFEKDVDGVHVVGVDCSKVHPRKKIYTLYEAFRMNYVENELLIWGTDQAICKNDVRNSIVIQHGIGWDIPNNSKSFFYTGFVGYLHKALRAYRNIQRASYAKTMVCVDYNYVNWHRAVMQKPNVDFEVVPNFSQIPDESSLQKSDDSIKIIFARRFFSYRGTRIFTEAILKVLERYSNVDVTIAGEGPDKEWMQRELANKINVHFITYSSDESIKIHSDKDIAVIPTVGSEGTSLSLLEAMASKCAVICSNVGGMTNIVINQYNGLMIQPNADSIYTALCYLIDNTARRKELAETGYKTIEKAFSLSVWKARWASIVQKF